MINFDDIIKDRKKERNSNLSQDLVHSFKILIIGSSGFGKTNALLDRMRHQPDIPTVNQQT